MAETSMTAASTAPSLEGQAGSEADNQSGKKSWIREFPVERP